MDPAIRMSMGTDDGKPADQSRVTARNASPASLRRLRVAELLAGDREVILEHVGQDYRLRITANGKLILMK